MTNDRTDIKCTYFLNIANTLAIISASSIAAFFQEMIKPNSNEIIEIATALCAVIVGLFAITSYLFAYTFLDDF